MAKMDPPAADRTLNPVAPHVVIVGAGFGGLAAAKALRRQPVRVTLLDRRNYHLFQPLLYQVAASTLSATEIAAPIRTILRSQTNLECLMAEVAGVELAGTLKEMSRLMLPREFRRIRAERARVVLVEGGPVILPAFGDGLSGRALHSLRGIGVEVLLGRNVTGVDDRGVQLGDERIPSRTVLWAAGVAASPLGRTLGLPLDRAGRVAVEPDLALAGHPEAFVIGDLALFAAKPLPGTAPVAIQQGRAAARAVLDTLRGRPRAWFRFRDRGSMATIGRGKAIAQMGRLHLSGMPAWLAWLFIHLMLLVGFQNRVLVLVEWIMAFLTTEHRSRLILAPFRSWRPPEPPGDVDWRPCAERLRHARDRHYLRRRAVGPSLQSS
jgi:NADH dehydrogenase